MAKKRFHVSEPSPTPTTEKKGLPRFVLLGGAVLALIIIVSVVAIGYRYFTVQQKTKSQVTIPSDPKALVGEVGKLIELPLSEEPTIATVSDVSKLRSQPFFVNAQNGDKVLIYQKAKKAILFRPATGKIVDVGPVNIDASASAATSTDVSGTPTPSKSTAQAINVSIYNGTKRSGLTRQAETHLTDAKAPAKVVEKTNAVNDYKETIVIDMNGKNKTQTAAIAKIVSGKVVSFPKGEATPSGTILVILGDNYKSE